MVIHLMKLFNSLPFYKLFYYTTNVSCFSIYHAFAKKLYTRKNFFCEKVTRLNDVPGSFPVVR